jgi:hypothetical protein
MYANNIQSFRKRKSKKVIVFKNSQKTKIENNTQPKPKFPGSFLYAFFYLDSCEITQKG